MIQFQASGLFIRIRESQRGDEVFDPFRKKWVVLTPEEWVRQSLLGYLVQQKKYADSLIAVERGVRVGERSRRFDAVIFTPNGKPWMLIECKSPGESLENETVSQLLAYQSILSAKFILLSNGQITKCWEVSKGGVKEQQEFPEFLS